VDGAVPRMVEMRNAYEMIDGKTKGKRELGRRSRR
jgi:hypothetical protein